MKFCERLKILRLNNNITQKELGKKLGISTVSIGNWEMGIKNPSMNAIISLAEVFGVSTDYLLGVSIESKRDDILLTQQEMTLLSNYRHLDKYGKKAVDAICIIEKDRIELDNIKVVNNTNITKFDKPHRYIPRYTTPSAAGFSAPLDGDDFEMLLVDDNVPTEADFAVIIQGNSMYPYIQDGDTVYVKKCCDLSIGDVGIFCVDGAMYCKQYYIDKENNLTLVSLNPELKNSNVYVSADSGSSVKCCGKVLLGQRVELPGYIFE